MTEARHSDLAWELMVGIVMVRASLPVKMTPMFTQIPRTIRNSQAGEPRMSHGDDTPVIPTITP